MPVVTFFPEGKRCNAKCGESILDIAFANLVEIDHNCSGVCACTSCRIFIKEGSEFLNKIIPDELFMLNTENLYSPGMRLACMCRLIKDENYEVIVEIPEKI